MWGGSNRDELLEGKYGRPHALRDMAGAFLLGVLGVVLLLGGAAIVVSLVR